MIQQLTATEINKVLDIAKRYFANVTFSNVDSFNTAGQFLHIKTARNFDFRGQENESFMNDLAGLARGANYDDAGNLEVTLGIIKW